VAALPAALAHGERLLRSNPVGAEVQAVEILRVVPGHPEALLLLGASKRLQGSAFAARSILCTLAKTQPRSARVQYELAMSLATLGEEEAAIVAFQRAVSLSPGMTEAWRALGDQLTLKGDVAGADRAYSRHVQTSIRDPALMEAGLALSEDRLAVAERLLRAHLKVHPTDVAAIRMLAETGTRLGRYADAEALLDRCLELAPSFIAARHNYAVVLYRQNKALEAIPQIDRLLAADPTDPGYRNLKAAALGLVGEHVQSIEVYESVLKERPEQPKVWLSYGHALKTAGRQGESIAAYRRTLDLAPQFGEAYWSLANLKTYRFTAEDVAAMEKQAARADLADEDRLHLHYALGKAFEDAEDFEASFEHYRTGAAIRRKQIDYSAADTTALVARAKALFTPAFFAERTGVGCDDAAPIFVVGLPRSGSTLVEQILASHSMVEGTMELPEIIAIARSLGDRTAKDGVAAYPEVLAGADADRLQALGAAFIARTRIHRKLGRPFFIDKMPNNFLHIGLIHLILPNAKIIDARRHPMATCFSGFKQHFARGQNFSYDLGDIGRYYRDYVALMAHVDAVLPGRVHRVFYEDMVTDTEAEVRRLLDYCGLPFEASCLKFYENDRAVRTASSEQVRRPIFRDGLDRWRGYTPWLDDLKTALGPVLDAYPSVPAE
jgi:tetratricopeptide (TPR) repeat protein